MKKNKIIKIEVVVLVVMWLIVAVSCSAYIFNEEPEELKPDSENNVKSDEDSKLWITSWYPINNTSVNETYMEI